MSLRFNPEKVVQAAAVLLEAHIGGQMHMLRMLKLLYIADRESLKVSGVPIIGDRAVAMRNGPLHSAVYDLIKGEHADAALWSKFIRNNNHILTLDGEPGRLELSKHDVRILNEVAEEFATMSDWDVVEKTHEFPEWAKHEHEFASANTSKPIPLEDIFDALEFSKEDRDAVIEDLRESDCASRVAAQHRHAVAAHQ